MATETPFLLRWGIISTGYISGCFVRDILVDPATRSVSDIAHKVSAVASRNVETAQKFVKKELKSDSSVKAYGTYDELFADPNIDAVYIGTPHTLHYSNSKDALLAGKHVLCEKPVTSNSAELRSLLQLAKEKNLFFMEALWTRFHPLTNEVKKVSEGGSLGDPVVLQADLSGDFDIESISLRHRILDPNLGGGALLDLGPYPLHWALALLYEHPKNNRARPTTIGGTILKTPLTGVDSSTSFTLNFSEGDLRAQAVLSCSINLPPTDPGVTIRYRDGNILIATPIFSPRKFTVQRFDKPGSGVIASEEIRHFKYDGVGWHFQADEVARCVRDGKLESGIWTHAHSLLEMEVFDEVRRQGDYKLPPGVEQVV